MEGSEACPEPGGPRDAESRRRSRSWGGCGSSCCKRLREAGVGTRHTDGKVLLVPGCGTGALRDEASSIRRMSGEGAGETPSRRERAPVGLSTRPGRDPRVLSGVDRVPALVVADGDYEGWWSAGRRLGEVRQTDDNLMFSGVRQQKPASQTDAGSCGRRQTGGEAAGRAVAIACGSRFRKKQCWTSSPPKATGRRSTSHPPRRRRRLGFGATRRGQASG